MNPVHVSEIAILTCSTLPIGYTGVLLIDNVLVAGDTSIGTYIALDHFAYMKFLGCIICVVHGGCGVH